MIIHFDNVNPTLRTGPNVFAKRLMIALSDLGHGVTPDAKDADLSLVFIEPSGRPLCNTVVQRLDGIWSKPNEFLTHNVQIKSLYDHANAVVFQSNFDREFITKHWGSCRDNAVIRNGIKINPITTFTSSELEQLRNSYDHVFVCSANWHPQKRLKDNTNLYIQLRHKLPGKSALIVLGNNPDYAIADPHIFYAGNVPEDVYMQIYSMANWMIHLAYLDHCPNVVLECLSQNTPVICSSEGGTKELVGDFGVIVNEQEKFDFNLVDYDQPPSIDFSNLSCLPQKNELGQHCVIDIEHVVKRYIMLFENALSS